VNSWLESLLVGDPPAQTRQLVPFFLAECGEKAFFVLRSNLRKLAKNLPSLLSQLDSVWRAAQSSGACY